MFFNPLIGYQTLPDSKDLDAKLISNNISTVKTPNHAFGMAFGAADRKKILFGHFFGTGLFVRPNTSSSVIKCTSISICYGRGILYTSDRTFLYPFLGARMFYIQALGKSFSEDVLDAAKTNLDAMMGITIKHFTNPNLLGVFNNFDLSCGFTHPIANGNWKFHGAEFVNGTYKAKPTFYFTFSIGRGFVAANY